MRGRGVAQILLADKADPRLETTNLRNRQGRRHSMQTYACKHLLGGPESGGDVSFR